MNYGMVVYKLVDIEVWVLNDNWDYCKVFGKQFMDGEIFCEGIFKEDVVFDLNKKIGCYVWIIVKGVGECFVIYVCFG